MTAKEKELGRALTRCALHAWRKRVGVLGLGGSIADGGARVAGLKAVDVRNSLPFSPGPLTHKPCSSLNAPSLCESEKASAVGLEAGGDDESQVPLASRVQER